MSRTGVLRSTERWLGASDYLYAKKAAHSASATFGLRKLGHRPPPKAVAAARRGSEVAKWVKGNKGKIAMGAGALGALSIANSVTKSGNGTDKTGFRQSRGMYMY